MNLEMVCLNELTPMLCRLQDEKLTFNKNQYESVLPIETGGASHSVALAMVATSPRKLAEDCSGATNTTWSA